MHDIKRIVVFGDSNTFGQGLSDNIKKLENHIDYNFPSNLAWPALLGKQFNVPVKNLAIPGCSNATIFRLVCNYLLNIESPDTVTEAHERMNASYCDGDLILIGLTEAIRKEFYDNRFMRYFHITAHHFPEFHDSTIDNSLKRIMTLQTDDSIFLETMHQVYAIKSLIGAKTKNYLLFHMLPVVGNKYMPFIDPDYWHIGIVKKYEEEWRRLLDNNYISNSVHTIASNDVFKCGHPNAVGHLLISKFLIGKLNDIQN